MSRENDIAEPPLKSGESQGPPDPGRAVDGGAIAGARQALEGKAKFVGKQLKELAEKTYKLEQLAFFDTPEFEEAMLLDNAESLRKRYTGEQAEKIEWRRDACLCMLANEIPVEDIARVLRMNLRTITSLAAKYGKTLGAFTESYAQRLMASAAADIAVAETKRQDASFKDLHIGAGIKMQHAVAVKLVSETGEKPAIDLEAADDKLKGLRDKLKRLAPADNSATENAPEAGNDKIQP